MDPYEAAKMRAAARAEHDEKFGKPEDMTDPRQNIPGEPIIVDAETYSKYENKPGPNGETVFLRDSGASRHVKPVWNDGGQVVTLKDIHDKYQTGVKYDFGKFSLDASFDSFPIGHKFRVCKDPWTLKGILETDRKRHKGQTRTICGDLEGEREKKNFATGLGLVLRMAPILAQEIPMLPRTYQYGKIRKETNPAQ